MACVLDTLCRVVTEFKNDKVKANIEKCRKQILLVKALFVCFYFFLLILYELVLFLVNDRLPKI